MLCHVMNDRTTQPPRSGCGPRPGNFRGSDNPDMQVWHLYISIKIQLQNLCKRDEPAKGRIRWVPAIDQDDTAGRLLGQHVPGNPSATVSEALTDLPFQFLGGIPDQS
ncbi:hypothetical protein J3B00_003009 [Pseudomonas sp. BP8]|nr:hypothetical protein [Pseudomonas sp. BP8]